MPEKFRIYRSFWDSTAVYHDIGLVLALGFGVDDFWDKFLPCTTFSDDQNRNIGRSHLYRFFQRSV